MKLVEKECVEEIGVNTSDNKELILDFCEI